MEIRWLEPDGTLDVRRGDVVVAIPVYGGHEHFVACLHSVLKHTPPEVRVLICDDASPDRRSEEFVRRLGQQGVDAHQLFYLRQPHNVGFPANMNGAFACSAPADVVIVNSDCVVAEGWLGGLTEAAYADSTVATATAVTNHGSLVSVPLRGVPAPLPQDWNVDQAAAAIREKSLRLRPRLPTAVGHCLFIRRTALELVGDFDLAFSPGYGEEVDFSQRCIQSGLCHVLADDVFVLHSGSGSFSRNGKRSAIQESHEEMLAARYPYYHEAVYACDEDISSPLARSLGAARRALKGLSVMVDARILSGATTGTQLHVVELIGALARTGDVNLSVLVPDRPSVYAQAALRSMDNVTAITRAEAESGRFGHADVIHRPYQVNNEDDIALLARLAERVVVTNQDLIGYHNPSYFRNFDAWQGYRRITRAAFSIADRVLFFSAHARDQALDEDLLDRSRASVIHIGVDHVLSAACPDPVPPRGCEGLPVGAEAILCIGTDFHHKNRVFALRVLEQLQLRHDWSGYLLFAGPTVTEGSSRSQEVQALATRPRVAKATIELAAVSEAEKAWLYNRSRVTLYPTVHEGFGLVPFESAEHGVPCLWAAGTSLSELLPDEFAGILAWDAAETADRALALLRDQRVRDDNLGAIREAARKLTWDRAASELAALYTDVCDNAATPGSRLGRWETAVLGSLSEDAMRLVGPDGALPDELERPLLALATHPSIGAPMFGAIKLGYRAGFSLRRRARPQKPSR